MNTFTASPSFILVVALTGCAVGPRFEAPKIDVPERFASSTNTDSATKSTTSPEADWWRQFDDESLNGLIDLAARDNLDLEVLRQRVRQARALRRATSAGLFPSIGSSASYGTFRLSENAPGGIGSLAGAGLADLDGDLFRAGFDASWEIDAFGGTRRRIERDDAVTLQLEEQHRDLIRIVVSEIARNYIELRGTQRRYDVAVRNAEVQSETLELVTSRFDAGLASSLDVERARSQASATRARLPTLRAAVRASIHLLGVLTGREPGAELENLLSTKPLPEMPRGIEVGVPSELLRRRPDIRASERALEAHTAAVGVAVADLYPKFFLTGTAGLESLSFSDLFTGASRTWTLGPTLSWPVFQFGRLRARVEASEAALDASYATYRQTVLLAIEESENALVRLEERGRESQELGKSVEAARRSVRLARNLYEDGLEDLLSVLDAERQQRELEDRLVASRTATLIEVVRLYKALGGGWQGFSPRSPRVGNETTELVSYP
ncbi:MAG: efflux transporter outer membrane subunit [Planctomycetota bacterium]